MENNLEPLQPISPSADKQCFNCGKDLETHATFCPHCGAPLPTQGSGFLIAMRIIGVILLAGLALLLGAAGACFMLFAGGGGISGSSSDMISLGLIGLLLIGLALLCVWGAIAIGKRR